VLTSPQSGIMGWMASLGSLARMVGAVLAGGAHQNNYMVVLFLCTIGGLLLPFVLLVAWVHIWKRKEKERSELKR